MLDMALFGSELHKYGFDFFSGVPCSFLKPMINYAINQEQFVMAANEGDAVAICAGAYLGGKKSVFLCQNSGLTNAVSPLTSLNYTFNIPVLGFVSLRGELGIPDEPQHELMGTITQELLDVMKVKNEVLSSNVTVAEQQLEKANAFIENGESFFFVVQKDTFGKQQLNEVNEKHLIKKDNTFISVLNEPKNKRIEVLEQVRNLAEQNEDILILATTGVTGRELFELGDSAKQFYMVGSMGCVSSIGLGLAMVQPEKKIIVVDGDGSLMMRMGSLATNAFYAPRNLYHLLLDNNLHESTGGQKTVASNVDFCAVADASGYDSVESLLDLEKLIVSINIWLNNQQLTFAYMKIKSGIKENLGRPTVTPIEVKKRFMNYLK